MLKMSHPNISKCDNIGGDKLNNKIPPRKRTKGGLVISN